MRTITTSCLAFLLLAALVSARLGDSAAVATPTPLDADVSDFLSGVWESIGLGRDYDDFVTCIEGDSNAATQLQKAMTLMNSSSASDVTKGLNRLDKVVSSLVAGLKACNMKDKYTSTINKIVNKFTSPSKLSVQTGSSILVNGVEVYTEVSAAVTAYDANNFDSCGNFIGAAMGKAFYGQDNVTNADQAKKLNALPNMTWTAGNTTAFDGLNLWSFKKAHVNLRRKKNLAKTNSTDNSTDTTEEADESRRNLAVTAIPAAFDSRTKWGKCIQPIRDQQACGSCWAFAASEVISDRFCIASNGSINKVLSPQYVMSCNTYGMGCNGGYLDLAWKFLESTGDVSDTCLPYKSGNGFVPACSNFRACADGTAIRKYYVKTNSTKMISGIAAIQTEIQKFGPVETAFDVYSDFPYYTSGIYTNTPSATYLGGHAVKIVGWGNTNGVNYWIVANSWGTYWGDAGYFKIKFGSCGIDGMVIAGTPDLTRS